MSTLPYLEIVQALRVTACPTCGMTHAIPAALFDAARRDQTPIFCAAGHSSIPLAADVDPSSSVDQRRIEAYAQLADVRLKLEAAQARLLAAGPADPGPIAPKELRRRALIIAGRADCATGSRYGKEPNRICPFCGSQQSLDYFPRHLRRRHTPELAAKPAAWFDQAADRILSRFE